VIPPISGRQTFWRAVVRGPESTQIRPRPAPPAHSALLRPGNRIAPSWGSRPAQVATARRAGVAGVIRRHPALRFELVANDRYQDLVTEGRHRPGVPVRRPARLERDGPQNHPPAEDTHGLPRPPTGARHAHNALEPRAPLGDHRSGVPSPTFSYRKDDHVTSVRVDSQLAIAVNEGATASAGRRAGDHRAERKQRASRA